MERFDVIVIGGGAAGMMAAHAAAAFGSRVLLLEKNSRLGRKLYITGKGRCNVTNCCDPADALQQVTRNSRFLYSAFYQFTPRDTMDFFEGHGCPLKVERGNRVFPVSDRSASIIDTMADLLKKDGVQVRHEAAAGLLLRDGSVEGVETARGQYAGKTVIICTGGCSYPATGSTGDGYRLAQQAGHTVVQVRGSLVPLEENGSWCAQMQGLSLRNVAIRLVEETKKCVFSDFGELLFTHFGLSGPVILSASAHMKPGVHYTVQLDLKPALDAQKLDARLLRDFEKYSNRAFSNALGDLLPPKLAAVCVQRSGIAPETKVNAITKEQRRQLLALLKCFSIELRGPRPVEEAIITAGGVQVREINPGTMGSKLVKGLYFAGELLDCDAYTGGYNLQIAWATGHAAGTAAAQWAAET